MYTNRGHIAKNKIVLVVVILLLLVLAGLYVKAHKNSKNLANNPTPVQGTTSQASQHKVPSPTSAQGQSGGVVDKNGQVSGSLPPSSQWISSNSSKITLQQPAANTVVHSGNSLTGLSKYGVVQFILKDDSVGQIAQGSLNVVNGKFSGALQFTPHASTGKLEVYHPNPDTGAQEDTIIINVSFDVQ